MDTKKRILEGIVVSDAMQKTRVIAVTVTRKHPRYGKFMKITNRFKAHDEMNEYKKGDRVLIEETRPLSREKRWKIVKLIARKEELKEESAE